MKLSHLGFSLLAACQADPSVLSGGPYGSQAIATSADGLWAYVVDPEERALAIVDVANDFATTVAIDGAPSRIARANDRLFITLRQKREVLVLTPDIQIVGRIATGAEPFGIVALGDRVYVACALSRQIIEIDAELLSVVRAWTTPGEPRWIAIHPSGRALYVASARNGEAYRIDLLEPDAVESIPLPSRVVAFTERKLVRRLTGDPTVTPDGKQLLLPAVFADNITPINDFAGAQYYAPLVDTLDPAVIAVQLDPNGRPIAGEAQVLSLLGPDVSGYPAGAVVSPSGDALLVPMETASAIMLADPRTEASIERHRTTERSEDTPPVFEGTEHVGFEPRPMSAIRVPRGPTSVAFAGDETAIAYCFLERRLVRISTRDLMPDERDLWKPRDVHYTDDGIELMPSSLTAAEERGRRLFYEGVDRRITRLGISCALCHFDGRDDGVTWTFFKGVRQTPSLAGDIELTAPYRWQGERQTVAENAFMTSQGMSLFGGMTQEEAADVERYIMRIPSPDSPRRGSNDEAIARGKEIFSRPDVGCATCHSGPAYTDNLGHDMLDLEQVQTPSLVGVASTAPYFHDGSSPTLRHLLERSRSGIMGDTSSLSDDEMRDLEAFLESL